jgi:hypothetical protein
MLFFQRNRKPVRLMPIEPKNHLLPEKGCCRYPFGDPRTKDFRYCDNPKETDSPYCVEHANLCFLRKPKDELQAARRVLNSLSTRRNF